MKYTVLDYLEKTAEIYPDKVAIVRNTNVCCDFESAKHGEIVYV